MTCRPLDKFKWVRWMLSKHNRARWLEGYIRGQSVIAELGMRTEQKQSDVIAYVQRLFVEIRSAMAAGDDISPGKDVRTCRTCV